jgi:hypothetical protein
VAADGHVALEPQQEVLADGVHGLEHATVDRARDVRHLPAGIRRRGLDALADEGPEPRGCAME